MIASALPTQIPLAREDVFDFAECLGYVEGGLQELPRRSPAERELLQHITNAANAAGQLHHLLLNDSAAAAAWDAAVEAAV